MDRQGLNFRPPAAAPVSPFPAAEEIAQAPRRGLTSQEAAARLARKGPNALPGGEPKSFLRMAAGVVLEPMFLMLLAAGGIYLLIGDRPRRSSCWLR